MVIDSKVCKKTSLKAFVWKEGKKLGEVELNFEIKHLMYFEQKNAGVLTENGVMTMSPLIRFDEEFENNQNINLIIKKFKKLKILIDEFDHRNLKNLSNEEVERTKAKLVVKISKLGSLFKITDKKSTVSFVYNSPKSLMNAQELFLDILVFLMMNYDSQNLYIDDKYYECMKNILKRGEFDLAFLTDPSTISSDSVYRTKINLDYQHFLYSTLSKVFDDLENKGLSIAQRNFIEFFLAYCYFRIDQFREELLFVLNKDQIYEENLNTNNFISVVLFDWRKSFYDKLPSDNPLFIKSSTILKGAIVKSWKKKFRSKGIIFFYFVKEWCEYIKKILVVNNIEWDSIPGYSLLINCFMEQMIKRDSLKYPEIMIDSSISLLNNIKIIDKLVYNLLSKTKLSH